MEMTEEMMDEAFQDDELDEEGDELANQIFDEIGLEQTSGLKNPNGKISNPNLKQTERDDEDELLRRLTGLKN